MRRSETKLVAILTVLLAATAARAGVVGPICGDVNKSGTLTASDALAVLKKSVGIDVKLNCPSPGTPPLTGVDICIDPDLGQVTCTGTGQDGELQEGVFHNLVNNGDGTISDLTSGLMWEVLSNDNSAHDVDDIFTWTSAYQKVFGLNFDSVPGFAGHKDWRLPNINELESISDLNTASPAVLPGFRTACPVTCTDTECSCTAFDEYWSSTPYFGSAEALSITPYGTTTHHSMGASFHVRAVRTIN